VGADPVAADAVIQGAAIGGEVPGAWVFVSEHVPQRHIGYACGTLTSGLTAGILLGSLVATAINSLYTPVEVADYAWRIPFLLGGVFGLFSVYLRRWLHETRCSPNCNCARPWPRKCRCVRCCVTIVVPSRFRCC
jgi:MFS family permease